MNGITWSSDMRVGQARMDAAHEALLAELAALESAGEADFCDRFCSMVVRLERDFREEERLMEEIDSPGLCIHREHHARVLAALHGAAGRAMQADCRDARAAVALLPDWFMLHLSTMDTALALTLELYECEGELQARPVP